MKKTACLLLALLALSVCLVPALSEGKSRSIDLEHDLFIVPVSSDSWDTAPGERDTALHFFSKAGRMYLDGAYLWGSEDMPGEFVPYEGEEGHELHIQCLKNPAGEQYVPLFTSFDAMFHFLGTDIHVGVASFEEAAAMAHTQIADVVDGQQVIVDCSGIVIAPGILNTIIPLDQLPAAE